MRRYPLLAGAIAGALLAVFALAVALGLPPAVDPGALLAGGGAAAAALGVALLVADVLLPVPSSLVMIAHGALFGFVAGALLSLAGCVGAAAFAFWLGRRGSPWIARWVPEAELRRAHVLVERWGDLAILVSRPLPVAAETVAILAGASPFGWGRLLASAAAGSMPAAAIYAVTGATAARLDSVPLVFGLVLGVAGLFWLARPRRRPPSGVERSNRRRARRRPG